MSAPQTISVQWKDLEGQSVGSCTLQAYVGGSEQSAVFASTRINGEKAAIKLTALDPRTSELKLARLRQAMRLSHPHLLRIYDAGPIELQGRNLLWVLTPFTDEDLSQILPVRALTPGETEQMLAPVLAAISYLQKEGFVHGRVKPSNIMAIGDQVKLSADSLSMAGDPLLNPARTAYDAPELRQGKSLPASDVWALGMTVVNALTQSLPSVAGGAAKIPVSLPAPYSSIAERCLQVDAGRRATISEIQNLLKPPAQPRETARVLPQAQPPREPAPKQAMPQPRAADEFEESGKRGFKPAYILPIAGLLLILLALWWGHKSGSRAPDTASAPANTAHLPRASSAAPSAQETASLAAHPEPERPSAASAPVASAPVASSGVQQVLPPISVGARNTVTGRVRVAIRARVDSEGNVIQTSFDSHGPSDYFARKANEAAGQWKFPPNPGETLWLIHFGFGRKDTLASATRLSR